MTIPPRWIYIGMVGHFEGFWAFRALWTYDDVSCDSLTLEYCDHVATGTKDLN